MKMKEVVVGQTYLARISGNLVRVRIDAEIERRTFKATRTGWRATNLATGREVTIKSASKLRSVLDGPGNYLPIRPAGTTLPGAMMPLG